MGIVFAIQSFMKKNLLFCFLLLVASLSYGQTPERFAAHRVKKGETLTEILALYKITEEQLLEYNPLLERIGIKRKMSLRIPIFTTNSKPQVLSRTATKTSIYSTHQVVPKETKWRLAYEYGMTVKELDSLNPQIVDGLKIGQEIRVRNQDLREVLPEKDSLFNYYKVLPSEGYYRIEKKLGVNKRVLDSLNPTLTQTGLQVGMILRIPDSLSGRLKIENDLLVERVNLLDSTLIKNKIKLGVLLPFKANEIVFDSIEDTKRTLEARNLHTISLDFYTGVLFALEHAEKKGIEIELTTIDTQNQLSKLREIIESKVLEDQDFIVGPLIPYNFDYVSNEPSIKNIPKIAPLSTRTVAFRKNVVQSVTEEKDLRAKMYEYLEKNLDTTQNVVIVADSTNRKIEKELQKRFPWAIKIRPEKSDYILPELADSLLIDSLPNKIILETQSFPLIASALSQFNAQSSKNREVQVFTTYRSNAYDNENLTRKTLGTLQFTYPTGFKPLDKPLDDAFISGYITAFGKPPNKEALRAYDVVLDAVLRTAYAKELQESLEVGETEYQSNRFYYRENENESFLNQGLYILQHQGYEIIEIKE
jgi:LysM repeat protein